MSGKLTKLVTDIIHGKLSYKCRCKDFGLIVETSKGDEHCNHAFTSEEITEVFKYFIEEQSKVNHWIKIESDQDLPEVPNAKVGFIVSLNNGDIGRATYSFADKTWADYRGKILKPTHYMPITDPGA